MPDTNEQNVTTTENEEPRKGIFIMGRNTYDNLVSDGKIDPTSIYFVQEDVTDSDKYLSLYVGLNRQTDIAYLNELTGFTDVTTINALQQLIFNSGTPPTNLLTTDKIYYWEDTEVHIFRAFIKSKINGSVLPIGSDPVWTEI